MGISGLAFGVHILRLYQPIRRGNIGWDGMLVCGKEKSDSWR